MSAIALTEAAASNCRSISPGTNPQLGTLICWYTPSSVANAGRIICAKGGGTQGITLQRQAADGTKFLLSATRSTTQQTCVSPTGVLKVGVPVCLAVQFDIASGSPTLYYGYLNSPMVDGTNSASNGTGTHDNSTGDYRIGATGANAAGGSYFYLGFFTVRMTLKEMVDWQFNPTWNARGCDALYKLSQQGSAIVWDRTGHAYHITTIASIATSPDYLPLPRAA